MNALHEHECDCGECTGMLKTLTIKETIDEVKFRLKAVSLGGFKPTSVKIIMGLDKKNPAIVISMENKIEYK